MALRATRQHVEVLQAGDANLRITRQYVEVLTIGEIFVDDSLTISDSLTFEGVYNKYVNDILLFLPEEIYLGGTTSYEITDDLTHSGMWWDEDGNPYWVHYGLGDSIEFDKIVVPGDTDRVYFNEAVSLVHVKASGTSISVTDTLSVSDQADSMTTGEVDNLTITEIISVDVSKGVVEELDIDDDVSLNLIKSVSMVDNLTIYHAATYELAKSDTYCTYTPFIGLGDDPDAPSPPGEEPTLTEYTNIELSYPAHNPTDTITLRGPELNNKERLNFQRIKRETRGGTLVVYASPIWPKIKMMIIDFVGLSESDAQDTLDFINTSLGKQIKIRDWEGREWTGIIKNPDNPIVRNQYCNIALTLEIEVNLIVDEFFVVQEIDITQSVNLEATLNKSITDTISIIDSVVTENIFTRALIDNITITDSFTSQNTLNKAVTDNVSVSDSISTENIFNRSLTDNISVSDVIATSNIFNRAYTDNVSVSDSISTENIFNRSLTDNVTVSDDIDAELVRELYWIGSTSSWNTGSNWSYTSGGASAGVVPDQYTDVYFDGNGTNDCTIDVNATAKSIDMAAGYTGHLDADTYNVTLEDGTFAGTQLSLGDGIWTFSGNLDTVGLSTLNNDSSEVKMTGTNKTMTLGANGRIFNKLTINGDTTFVNNGNALVHNDVLTIDAVFTFTGADVVGGYASNADIKITSDGQFNGTNYTTFAPQAGNGVSQFDGSMEVGVFRINYPLSTCVFKPGYYNTIFRLYTYSTRNDVLTLEAGSYQFKSIYFTAQSTATGSLTLDCSTNGPTVTTWRLNIGVATSGIDVNIDNSGQTVDWTITGDVIVNMGTGTFTWTKGNGKISIENTSAGDYNFDNQTIEEIEIDTSATITISGGVTTDYFLHKGGTVDIGGQNITTVGNFTVNAGADFIGTGFNGSTITVGGNFDANGQSGDLLDLEATTSWTLAITGTGTADYVNVDYSNASVSAVNATNSTDGGHNTNWNFS